MNAEETLPEEGPGDAAVDRLVRSYLEGEAERADATALVERIRQTRAATPAPSPLAARPSPLAPRLRTVWWAATAAGIVVAFLGGRFLGPKPAGAAVVLGEMRAIHAGPIDRAYQVQYAPDPRHWDGKNKLEGPSHSLLWTRGDQFWADCTIGELRLGIGREPDGALWVGLTPKRGVRFTNDDTQLPEEVALICAVNAMSVPRLVDDVLADFDLRVERPGQGPARALVWATLRPGRSHTLLSDAMLEIDTERNVLVRLVLWTVRDGRPKGTVTYTLLENAQRETGPDPYLLQSHLDDDAQIEVHTMKRKGK